MGEDDRGPHLQRSADAGEVRPALELIGAMRTKLLLPPGCSANRRASRFLLEALTLRDIDITRGGIPIKAIISPASYRSISHSGSPA